MATIIVCDGGCGAQSPNPRTGLHDAVVGQFEKLPDNSQ